MTSNREVNRRVDLRRVISLVLAGGRGERLMPLTAQRAKPAVPIAGNYRIIDFIMNSLINSGFLNIRVMIQFKSQPFIRHIECNYPTVPRYGIFIEPVPAQQRTSLDWFTGTADAVYQNLYMIEEFEQAIIFSGDHIFVMDVFQMLQYHREKQSDFTIAAIPTPIELAAGQLGVIVVDEHSRIIEFQEKPCLEEIKEIPGLPGMCYASMGNYIAHVPMLSMMLKADALKLSSNHDFGKNIIPEMLLQGYSVFAYNFHDNRIEGQEKPYWRDLGTIASYHAANMDVAGVKPEFNLYNEFWPLHSVPEGIAPHKICLGSQVDNCLISSGCITNKANLFNSVLSPKVVVESARVVESVLFSGVKANPGADLFRCIVDKNVVIPPGMKIGIDHAEDQARGLTVVDGITVVPKNFVF